jgi:hypothetical protein
MISGGRPGNKFNLISQEENKRAIAELEDVNKQIDKRSLQIKKISETSIDLRLNTIPGTLNFKDLDPEKNIFPEDSKK